MTSYPGGYAALIATLMLSTMLSLLVFEHGADAFLARLAALHAEQYAQAREDADGCARIALRNMALDAGWRPGSPMSLHLDAGHVCFVESVIEGAGYLEIITRAQEGETQSAVRIRFTRNESPPLISIQSWESF